MEFYIITDSSGGMREDGKYHVAKSICRTIHRESQRGDFFEGVCPHFMAWGEAIEEFSVDEGGILTPPLPLGRAPLGTLVSFMRAKKGDAFLVLTDGIFPPEESGEYEGVFKNFSICAVAVGPDSDMEVLDLLTEGRCFAAENLYAALSTLDWHVDGCPLPPNSTEGLEMPPWHEDIDGCDGFGGDNDDEDDW